MMQCIWNNNIFPFFHIFLKTLFFQKLKLRINIEKDDNFILPDKISRRPSRRPPSRHSQGSSRAVGISVTNANTAFMICFSNRHALQR